MRSNGVSALAVSVSRLDLSNEKAWFEGVVRNMEGALWRAFGQHWNFRAPPLVDMSDISDMEFAWLVAFCNRNYRMPHPARSLPQITQGINQVSPKNTPGIDKDRLTLVFRDCVRAWVVMEISLIAEAETARAEAEIERLRQYVSSNG